MAQTRQRFPHSQHQCVHGNNIRGCGCHASASGPLHLRFCFLQYPSAPWKGRASAMAPALQPCVSGHVTLQALVMANWSKGSQERGFVATSTWAPRAGLSWASCSSFFKNFS